MYETVKIIIDIAFVVVAAIVIFSAIKKMKKKQWITKGQEENPGLSFCRKMRQGKMIGQGAAEVDYRTVIRYLTKEIKENACRLSCTYKIQ